MIPKLTNLSAKIADILQKLHQCGGKIYVIKNNIENVPLTVDGQKAPAEFVKWLTSLPTFEDEKSAASTIAENIPEIVRITENGIAETDILSTWRDTEIDGCKGRFYLFVNSRYAECSKVEISLPSVGNIVKIMNCEKGEFSILNNVENIDGRLVFDYPFAQGEGLAVFVSNKAGKSENIYNATDFSVLPVLKKLSDKFEIISAGEGNIITLDRCRYRIDDGNWIYDDVSVIHHRLLHRKCDCDLEMEFDFDVNEKFDLATSLTLISETPEIFEYSLNGKKFEAVDGGKFFDQAFRRILLPQNLKYGTNTINLKCRYHQEQNVYDSLEKAKKFETEYNKLTYDTEIENIYLVGNFCVEHNGRVEQLERQAKRYCGNFTLSSPLLNSMVNAVDIAENGMPFFAGKIKIQKKFSLTAEECSKCKYLRFKHIGVNSYRIKINGIEAGFLYTGQFAVSVENMLVEGENVLEIEMSVSLRNMLGPHHLEEGEAYMVLTTSWQKESDGILNENLPYNAGYCFVEFGLTDIVLV